MSGILGMLLGPNGTYNDTQTITVGGSGTAVAQDRRRGYLSGSSGSFGSISDGTSNIFGGAAITAFYYDESYGTPFYTLTITGATNSNWTKVTVGSKILTRASAGFSSGTWTWDSPDTVDIQPFSSPGAVRTVYFE